MSKAIFFDRDGIITPMIYEPEEGLVETVRTVQDVSLMFGVVDVMKRAKEKGYLLIVVSNQPNIGLGKITEAVFEDIRTEIKRQLKEQGITLDDEYYAYYHPYAKLEKYKKIPDLRKPKPDMILDSAKKHTIDISQSWMIGDGVNDVKAGHTAGCKTALLGNTLEGEYMRILQKNLDGVKPDIIIKKLPEFIEYI